MRVQDLRNDVRRGCEPPAQKLTDLLSFDGHWKALYVAGDRSGQVLFIVQRAACRVQRAACRVQRAACSVQRAGCRLQGAGCRVQGAVFSCWYQEERGFFYYRAGQRRGDVRGDPRGVDVFYERGTLLITLAS